MRVLGISGSLRRGSFNSALLRAAGERLPGGAELVEFDRLGEIPLYDEDLDVEPAPAAVRELREALREADAVLIATPEYNHSIPGGSRTPSTGPPARPARAPSAAPRRRRSAPRPGCSEGSGPRPRPARSSARWAARSSRPSYRWPTPARSSTTAA